MLLKIPTIALLTSLAVVLPIITGSITTWKQLKAPLRTLFIYFVVYTILEAVGWYYALHNWQNHFLQNTVSYLDILFLGTYFYQILQSTWIKKIVISLIVITLVLTVWSHLATGRDYNRLDSFALSVGSLAMISMSLLFFYQLLNNLDVKNLLTYSNFWIVVGILIYFSGAFFTFIFAEYIAFSKDEATTQYFQIHEYLLFLQRIFLAIGLWFSKTPQQLSPSSK
jgi:uncharacterized membrane protein YfcA